MPRPTILHCFNVWVPDGGGPLVEIIDACTGTNPVVLCGERRVSGRTVGVTALNLDARRWWLPRPGARRRALFLLASAVRFRARLIHVHDLDWWASASIVARWMRIPVAVTLHRADVERPIGHLVTRAALITVLSAEDAERALVTGCPSDRIALFDRATDVTRAPRDRKHVVVRDELGRRAAELDAAYAACIAGRSPPLPAMSPDRELPTVSVIIPSFNRRTLLARALDALEHQTYPADRVEVVVVDNGSTDGTEADVRSRTPPWRLTLLRNEVNTSAAAARNRALAHATGEVVAFTDSDCRPTPTWLEALVAGFDGVGMLVQGRTIPDAEHRLGPLARSQSVPWEYGLYETCNIAYDRAALALVGEAPFSTAIPDRVHELLGDRIGRQAFGEDTHLAWRAKRAGARSRFAVHAVVRHHVFESDLRYLVDRAALLAGFPVLVAEVPELRKAFLWRRTFLSADRPLVWAALAGFALGMRRPSRLVLAAPYLVRRIRPREPGAATRLAALPRTALVDLVATGALTYGSIRTGRPVL